MHKNAFLISPHPSDVDQLKKRLDVIGKKMMNKSIIILLLLIFGFNIVSLPVAAESSQTVKPQINPEDKLKSRLIQTIAQKTSFSVSDPAPSTTSWRGKKLSFPWLYLERSEWENLSGKLEDPYFKEVYERNVKGLEILGEEQRARAGGDPDLLLTPIRILKGWVQRATVCWYITKESKYLEMAKTALSAACHSGEWKEKQPSRIHLNAANLRTAELLFIVSFGYDALYPYLDESTRRTCLEALIEKGLKTYLEGHLYNDWWVACDFNWNSALHGNAGIAALVVRDVKPELSNLVLELATTGLPHMIKAFYPGGGYIEGLMYQCTAIGTCC